MNAISHDPQLPHPDEDFVPPAGEVGPTRSRRLRRPGRAVRVILWAVVVTVLACVADALGGQHLLPPWRSLLPGAGEGVAPSREVSRERIVAATDELDRALVERLGSADEPARSAGKASGVTGSERPTPTPTTTTGQGGVIQPLENPCVREEKGVCRERALDRFYAALHRTARREPGAVTRITHFGDSIIVEDLWTSTVRRRLQERFGDGGAGFLFVAKPWEWYGHLGVALKFTDAWHIYRVTTGHIHDALYGYGGVSFIAGGPGAKATFGTVDDGTTGRAVSRFEVYYLGEPGGGQVEVTVDGASADTFSTAAPATGSGFRLVTMPDGPHELTVRSLGGGPVRLFGVTMERAGPGVVYDGIGLLGASARALLEPDAAHWAEQFAHRRPDLVVLTFGTNESDGPLAAEAYGDQVRRVVERVRTVAPFASCLLVGPPDRGDPNTRETRPVIPKIIDIQRRVAREGGCAFWDTFDAMGGANTMWRWYRANPRRTFGDLTHVAPAGGEILGDLLYAALLQGFLAYVER